MKEFFFLFTVKNYLMLANQSISWNSEHTMYYMHYVLFVLNNVWQLLYLDSIISKVNGAEEPLIRHFLITLLRLEWDQLTLI